MNYNQNKKLMQITPDTLIVGIDIAKHKHVARAQDDRGMEFSKPLHLENSIIGFERLRRWIETIQQEQDKNDVIVGVEPTGHYWLNLAYYAKANEIPLVIVNPMHVKRTKEFDDNSPSKNDTKDARVIAQLVKDGRYSEPNLLEGIYAELREGMKIRDQLSDDLQTVMGRVDNWLDRYFPEFVLAFADWDGKAALYTLEHFALPSAIQKMEAEEILQAWRNVVKQGVGIRRAEKLKSTAKESIGLTVGQRMAQHEITRLVRQYRQLQKDLEELDQQLEAQLASVPGAQDMMDVPGLGFCTVATLFSEVGDIRNYEHPRQIQKMAGLSLREHSSGKFKGQTKISKRGRRRLRKALYLAVRPMVVHNEAFRALHHYYTTRSERPLCKQASLIALCCKLIRVLHAMAIKGKAFDAKKMMRDMPHIFKQEVAAA